MEVHHKHHIPKKITEYFTEFLMLFTAVTLGFFAENYREHSLVESKMKENYESLIEDLKSDSIKMSHLISDYPKGNKVLMDFSDLLYKFHSKAITYEQFVTEYKKLKEFPNYNTVFINNTTFKNIQSSGMLSYINDKSLRFEISFYYEVMFKQLQDNNALFDRDGVEFFDRNLPFTHAIGIRTIEYAEGGKKKAKLVRAYSDKYFDFVLHLPETKRLLTADKLIFQCQVYHDRYASYNFLLMKMMEKNALLLKELRSVHH
ncbi:MAG: hypothetical protein ACKOWL_00360 [Sphingobacteriaceae bacterium]